MARHRKPPDPSEDQDEALLARLARVRTLLDEVGAEAIGDRVRRLRDLQSLSIRAVAERAGISKNSIVRLEQGGGSQPITLIKVCAVLGVHVDRLAEAGLQGMVNAVAHRRADDRWFDAGDMGSPALLGLDRALRPSERRRAVERGARTPVNLLRARLPDGRVLPSVLELYQETEPRSHVGEEFVYVLSGRARITIGDEAFVLAEGESVTFHSAEPHRYGPADPRRVPVRVLSVRIDG